MVFVFKIDHDVPMPPTREQLRQQDDDRVLRVLIENPGITKRAIAQKAGCVIRTGVGAGQPNMVRLRRSLNRIRENGLVK